MSKNISDLADAKTRRGESRLARTGLASYHESMPTVVTITDKEQRQLWTAEDFLEWLEPGVHADLIDGERFMHSPVNFKHARLVGFLDRLLAAYVEQKKLGELHREVVAVRLSSRNVFLPDLCFFTCDQVPRLAPAHAPFAPTLVVDADLQDAFRAGVARLDSPAETVQAASSTR